MAGHHPPPANLLLPPAVAVPASSPNSFAGRPLPRVRVAREHTWPLPLRPFHHRSTGVPSLSLSAVHGKKRRKKKTRGRRRRKEKKNKELLTGGPYSTISQFLDLIQKSNL
uniref:Uncharacterized protein n=1 Tax=Oryza glumipatula TaxID=40148 RepID=A0A0D9ZAU7_9ORYZ